MKQENRANRPRRGIKYLRQSVAKEETISDEIQRAACDNYARTHGIEWITITDPDWPSLAHGEIWEQHTGRVWNKRRGVQRALELIEQGEAEVIVLWKWSRLSRRRLHWAVAEDQVQRLGGTIESATEPTDLTTASGRFSRGMLVEVAHFESDRIGESWAETHENRRRRGLPAIGGRRYGYHWIRQPGEPERYEINPDEAETLRWAYQAYLDGLGWAAITQELNRRGITNTRGRPWSTTVIRDTLDSGFAAGLLHRVDYRDGKVIRCPIPQRRWDKGAHEPIIDQSTWQAYKHARERRNIPPRTNTPTHPLAGLLRCECGASMHRKPSGRNSGQFICGYWRQTRQGHCITVSEARVTRLILGWITELAADVDAAAAAYDRGKEHQLRSQADAKTAAAEVAEIDRQLAAAFKAFLAGRVPDAAYQMVRADLERDRAAAAARLATAEAEATRQVRPPIELAVSLSTDWDILPIRDRRDTLRHLIAEVRVYQAAPNAPGVRTSRLELATTWGEVCALE